MTAVVPALPPQPLWQPPKPAVRSSRGKTRTGQRSKAAVKTYSTNTKSPLHKCIEVCLGGCFMFHCTREPEPFAGCLGLGSLSLRMDSWQPMGTSPATPEPQKRSKTLCTASSPFALHQPSTVRRVPVSQCGGFEFCRGLSLTGSIGRPLFLPSMAQPPPLQRGRGRTQGGERPMGTTAYAVKGPREGQRMVIGQ